MKKRWRAGLGGSLVALGLAVAGCTGPATPVPTPTADPWQDHGPIVFAVTRATSTIWQQPVRSWNDAHPNEQVTLLELPDDNGSAIATRAESGSGEYTVMSLDVNWTAEFASKGWLAELPARRFPTDAMIPAATTTGTYQGRLYAYPQSIDATVLRYRSDLLAKARQKVPTTWAEVKDTCAKVLSGTTGMACFAGPYGSASGLSTSFVGAVRSAGGQVVLDDGSPDVDSSPSIQALDTITQGLSSGVIPAAATGWSEQRLRQEFDASGLVYLQDWWASGPVVGEAPKSGVAPVPGMEGIGVSVQGGRNLGIAARATNKGTAADFVNYLVTPDVQLLLAEKGWSAPVLSALYTDDKVLKAVPSLKVLSSVLETAQPLLPSEHERAAVQAIDEKLRPVLTGTDTPTEGLDALQSQLEQLLK